MNKENDGKAFVEALQQTREAAKRNRKKERKNLEKLIANIVNQEKTEDN